MREVHRRDQGVVLDPDLVVVLVALLQATQDRDGLRRRRLVHHHHLEPPLQGLVGLEILLVLVQGGGADRAELATRQGRLQDVGRIHRTGRTPGAHQRMDLIDEQDDLAGGIHHFLHDPFEPLLEFTLIFRTRDEGAHVQGIHLLGLQVLRNVAGDDVLGDTLRDGGLAHARFTHEDRVVLGPPGEDLEHPPDLVVPADDRIQLPLGGPFVQIHCKTLQERVLIVICHSLCSPFYPGRDYAATAVCPSRTNGYRQTLFLGSEN